MQPVVVSESSSPSALVMGTDTQFLLTGAQTNDQFTLYRITAPRGSIVPTHIHDREDETFIVRQGQLRIGIENQYTLANPGAVVFGPRGIPHSWEAVSEEDAVFEVLTTPSGMETMFRELGRLPAETPMETILEICERARIHFLPVSA